MKPVRVVSLPRVSRSQGYVRVLTASLRCVVFFLLVDDDICGVGLSIRFGSDLVSVWNRDASNQKSVDAILAVVLDQLPDELKPTKANYYYKKHSEHKGFTLPATSG